MKNVKVIIYRKCFLKKVTKEIQLFCSINLSVKKVFSCESFKYTPYIQVSNAKL